MELILNTPVYKHKYSFQKVVIQFSLFRNMLKFNKCAALRCILKKDKMSKMHVHNTVTLLFRLLGLKVIDFCELDKHTSFGIVG